MKTIKTIVLSNLLYSPFIFVKKYQFAVIYVVLAQLIAIQSSLLKASVI